MKQKMSATDYQFRRYLSALLGDKHQEKVLDIIAKVDKGFKLDGELEARLTGGNRHLQKRSDRAPARKSAVRCFYCGRIGHVQARCFKKQRDTDEPDSKRQRRDDYRAWYYDLGMDIS